MFYFLSLFSFNWTHLNDDANQPLQGHKQLIKLIKWTNLCENIMIDNIRPMKCRATKCPYYSALFDKNLRQLFFLFERNAWSQSSSMLKNQLIHHALKKAGLPRNNSISRIISNDFITPRINKLTAEIEIPRRKNINNPMQEIIIICKIS